MYVWSWDWKYICPIFYLSFLSVHLVLDSKESIEHRSLGYADTNSDAPLLNSPYMEEEKYIKTSHGGTASRLEQIQTSLESTVCSFPQFPACSFLLVWHIHVLSSIKPPHAHSSTIWTESEIYRPCVLTNSAHQRLKTNEIKTLPNQMKNKRNISPSCPSSCKTMKFISSCGKNKIKF